MDKMTHRPPLENRAVIALEKIARSLAAIEEALLRVTDGNDGSLRMKDIERASVYSKHLAGKMRGGDAQK